MNWFKLFKKSKRVRSLKTIDKEAVSAEIEQNRQLGLSTEKRNPRVIVSLTSFPQRMYDIHFGLYSLLNQTFKPDEVILWLGAEQFPNLEDDLPRPVLALKEKGLTIKWFQNLHSYTKLVPSLREFPDDIIVTADDDIYYEPEWLEKLYNAHLQTPNDIVCHRALRVKLNSSGIEGCKKWSKPLKKPSSSLKNFLTGVGGVLYPPKSLYKDADNIELFTSLSPREDDLWFWAMAVLQGTKITVVKDNIIHLMHVNPERERGLTGEITLFSKNKNGGTDNQVRKVTAHYPEILNVLKNI
ncbi:MAG: glycosyltransferase [Heliobacteriaceae bacterium]|jgi:hypothetical protein|nr:glycosyltransferase [Heliobacteriaceae bacterium]